MFNPFLGWHGLKCRGRSRMRGKVKGETLYVSPVCHASRYNFFLSRMLLKKSKWTGDSNILLNLRWKLWKLWPSSDHVKELYPISTQQGIRHLSYTPQCSSENKHLEHQLPITIPNTIRMFNWQQAFLSSSFSSWFKQWILLEENNGNQYIFQLLHLSLEKVKNFKDSKSTDTLFSVSKKYDQLAKKG